MELTEMINRFFNAIIIGGSAGSLDAAGRILEKLPEDFAIPIVLVSHRHPDSGRYFEKHLNSSTALNVKQVDEKEPVNCGTVYVAPPNYHLLIEEDFTFSLTLEEPCFYSRPSIDVTFESAAEVWGEKLAGVIVTGANSDGTAGLNAVKKAGGFTLVQSPETAEYDAMPQSAIEHTGPDFTGTPEEIGELLLEMHNFRVKGR